MKTIPLYFDDSYLFEAEANVVATGEDDKGSFIVLDKTLFYPQGGGQPYDVGSIDDYAISAVRWAGDEARHYTSGDLSPLVGKLVALKIDEKRRYQHSRYHTAGHLLAHIIEAKYPGLKAIKGHHYLDGAYVEFASPVMIDLAQLNQLLADAIKSDLEITARIDSPNRYIQIGEYGPFACGGTHIKTLRELAQVIATKQKGSRVTYSVAG